ncbi:Uncharacterised protein [uncultured archaeon]|nr:Uncharacterised protein [uncultured archaeon]
MVVFVYLPKENILKFKYVSGKQYRPYNLEEID